MYVYRCLLSLVSECYDSRLGQVHEFCASPFSLLFPIRITRLMERVEQKPRRRSQGKREVISWLRKCVVSLPAAHSCMRGLLTELCDCHV